MFAEVTTPLPLVTVQLCPAGDERTVTLYGLPVFPGAEKLKGPLALIGRLFARLSCSTKPLPTRPVTVPPTVNDDATPTPLRATFCVEGGACRALSVKTAVLVSGFPALCGSKLMLRLQASPGVSAKEVEQSAAALGPGTSTKFGPLTTSPGLTAFNVWLPMF